jgi:hypothetical protein
VHVLFDCERSGSASRQWQWQGLGSRSAFVYEDAFERREDQGDHREVLVGIPAGQVQEA